MLARGWSDGAVGFGNTIMRSGGSVRFPALFVAALLALAGCANTRLSHEPGLIDRWKAQPAYTGPVPALSVVLHRRLMLFGQPAGFGFRKWWVKRGAVDRLEGVMKEFPVLGQASLEAEDAEYRLYIEGTHSIDGNKTLKIISGITKYVIPSWEHGSVELDARLYRGDEELKRYRAVGHYKVRWFLLILAAPWMWHMSVPSEVVEDTFRDLFIQLQDDGAQVFLSASRVNP